MIRTRIAVMTLAMLSVAVIDACRHKAPEVTPTPVVTRDTSAEAAARAAAERRRADSIAAARAAEAQRRRADSIAAARAAADRDAAAMANVRNTLIAVVHFDLDQADLRSDATAALDAKIPILQANPTVTLGTYAHLFEQADHAVAAREALEASYEP